MAAFSAAPFIGPTIGTFPHLVSPGSSRFAALEKMEGVKEVETGSIARWERGGGGGKGRRANQWRWWYQCMGKGGKIDGSVTRCLSVSLA